MLNDQEKKNLVREYVRALNQDKAALFAGAGLSIPSGGLSWTSLLEDEANAIGIDVYKEHDLTSVAQYIYNETGSRQVINGLLKNHINTYGKENLNHKVISSLPIKKMWTTNYDDYIERSLQQNGKIVDIKKSVEDMTSEVEDADSIVYKMHGDIGSLNNTVIMKDDYEIYDRKNELFINALQNDLMNKTFLFFGFSFDDPNLQSILSKVRIMVGNTSRRHYCILKQVSIDDDEFTELEEADKKSAYEYRINLQRLKVNDLKRYGIHAILVETYDEMTQMLMSIKHHYLADKLFISGAYDKIDNFLGYKDEEAIDAADKFVQRLGARLHQEKYKVKSGFGLGVGRNIIQGFLDVDAKSGNKRLTKNLIIHPFPSFVDDNEKHNYRLNVMDEVGVCIILFGNKLNPTSSDKLILSDGVLDEYKVALEKNQFIVPVGITGYMAKELWKKLPRVTQISKMNTLIEELNDDSFTQDENKSKEEKISILIDKIFNILDLYKDNIDKLHFT